MIIQLVGSEDDTDENMGYLINDELPPLIMLGKNPGFKMLESAAEAAAWGAVGPAAAAAGHSPAEDDRADADLLEGARRASAENIPLRAGEAWQGEGRR